MSYYPYINTTHGHILDLMLYANTVTNDLFGVLTLLTIFIIAFTSLKTRYPTVECIPPATLFTAIMSYLFAVLGLVGTHVTLYPTILFVVSLFFLFRER